MLSAYRIMIDELNNGFLCSLPVIKKESICRLRFFKTKFFIIWLCVSLYTFLAVASPVFCLQCLKKESESSFNASKINCICCHEQKNFGKCNHCVKTPVLPGNKEKNAGSSGQNIADLEKIINLKALNFNYLLFSDNKNSINLFNSYLPLNLNLKIIRTIVLLT